MATAQALVNWLDCMFMDRHEKRTFYRELFKGSDTETIPHLISKFGGQEAVEIECFAAPISELLKRGYAPGGYSGKCCACQKEFVGDKRAIACLPCVVSNYDSSDDC